MFGTLAYSGVDTSKLDSPSECHGSNGDFLAAVAALSLLSITSHHRGHHSHNFLSVHHSAVVSRHTPSLPEQRLLTFSHGTRVSVRDLFGSIPVRAKQRPASSDRSSIEKEWRRLLRDLIGLILPWPTSVSVYMRETNTNLELRFRPPQRSSTPDPHSLVPRVSRTLTQANLADPEDADSWEKVTASGAGISVTGALSLNPVATRRSQFISLGITPLPNDAGANVLYEEVNRVFANSAFALEDESKAGSKGIFGQKPRKGVERWPMFYFRVDIADRSEGRCSLDQFLDQGHRVEGVVDLLKAVCYEFLKKHHFSPRSSHGSVDRRQLTRSRESSPASRLSTAPTRSRKGSPARRSPFDMWSRVKAGKPLDTEKPGSPVVAQRVAPSPGAGLDGSEQGRQSPAATQPLLNREGKLVRAPFPDALEPEESGTPRPPPPKRPLKRPRPSSTPPEVPGTREKQGDSHTGTTPRHQKDNEPSPWLADLLKTWKNPVFPPAQPQIPKTHDDALPRTHHHLPETPTTSLQSRISRPALLTAEVISQVDRKFILTRLPNLTSS
ncbi:hypothetical protein IMZ48_12575, partial [Candidatus Bathyarchaeota archaeon]|nr:hypothetical protein [Candidatus Bathyarchaeota archaeon]